MFLPFYFVCLITYSTSYLVIPILKVNDEYYELRKVLKAASTKDKTVILAFLNKAWAAPNSIFDLFIESFRIGNNTEWLLNHLLVVAVDDDAYSRCQASVSHCYFLNTNQSSELASQATFMTPSYLDMIWTRLSFCHTILSLGYNFLVTVSIIILMDFIFILIVVLKDDHIKKVDLLRDWSNAQFSYI